MAKIKDYIERKYYFVTGGIIYEISKNQDADKCGVCPSHDDDGKVKKDSELAGIFPYIKLTYSGGEKYLWLQDFIEDGDTFNGSSFGCTANLHKDPATTFVDRYINQVKKDIYAKIKGGYTAEMLKKEYPKYLSSSAYEDTIGGKNVSVSGVSLTSEQQILSDTNIGKLYEDEAKIEAEIAANRILYSNKKKVKEKSLTFTAEDIEAEATTEEGGE